MCGRFVVAKTSGQIATIFEVDEVIDDLPLSYNVAPTNRVPIVVDRAFEKDQDGAPLGDISRELHAARWGLVPRWSKSPGDGAPLINARMETVLEKPSFKDSVVRRRCLVPASGYYEWVVNADGSKQPYYVNAGSDGMFGFAGIFEWWADPAKKPGDPGRWLLSTTILTKPSAPELAHIHERNPVFLSGDTLDVWLDSSIEGDRDLLAAIAHDSDLVAGDALFHRVDSAVGRVSSSGPELIRAI
ncbi:MAG: SOS response-associated peptidase [Micrococcales bacterium]